MIYSREYQKINEHEEPHMFLECFQKITKIQYVSCFGI